MRRAGRRLGRVMGGGHEAKSQLEAWRPRKAGRTLDSDKNTRERWHKSTE
jgi:hypothetical protein